MTKGHFEAKKHSYRQTQDGVVVSFVIHPNDVPAELATAPLGTIYMIGFSTIPEHDAALPNAEDVKGILKPAKPKQKWSEMRPSAQAAMACDREDFREYMNANNPTHCDLILKSWLGISSKRELDDDAKTFGAQWRELWGRFDTHLGTQRAIEQHKAHART